MSNTRQILAMLQSRAEGDEDQFYSIALQVAAAEARMGHRSIAEALRTAVEQARSSSNPSAIAVEFSKPRGELEGLIAYKDPRYVLKDVVLNESLKSILDSFIRQQQKRNWLREHGKVPDKRLLFIGPPGSGKTMTAEALAGQLKLPLFIIKLETLISRYMGETAAKLRLIFDEISKRRGVYLFDEFDAIGSRRTANNDVAEMRRILNSFLQYIEEENSTDSVIIGATNHPEILDNALLRRFDAVAPFQAPTEAEIQKIIKLAIRPYKAGRLSWKKIVNAASGLSQAEITRATENTVKAAILDELSTITTEYLLKRINERHDMKDAFLNIG